MFNKFLQMRSSKRELFSVISLTLQVNYSLQETNERI